MINCERIQSNKRVNVCFHGEVVLSAVVGGDAIRRLMAEMAPMLGCNSSRRVGLTFGQCLPFEKAFDDVGAV